MNTEDFLGLELTADRVPGEKDIFSFRSSGVLVTPFEYIEKAVMNTEIKLYKNYQFISDSHVAVNREKYSIEVKGKSTLIYMLLQDY